MKYLLYIWLRNGEDSSVGEREGDELVVALIETVYRHAPSMIQFLLASTMHLAINLDIPNMPLKRKKK